MHRIIVQIGPFVLYSYGLFIALGFVVASLMALHDSRRQGMSVDNTLDCLVAVLAGGLTGGRLLFVFLNWRYFAEYPMQVIMLQQGGMAFQGALAGAVLGGALVVRVKRMSFWLMADLIAPYVPLGQAIGRIGCFMNGCCYGVETRSFIGVVFPGESVMRVPVQLYYSAAWLALFAVLLWRRRGRMFSGQIFLEYVIGYSLVRFLMDFLRGDLSSVVMGIRLTQAVALFLFCGSAAVYLAMAFRNKCRGR